MIPVSVRDPDSKGALGNKVSAMLAALPTHLADPAERLEVAHAATKVAKSQQAAIPQGLVDQISDFAPPALTARAARVVFATGVLHRLPPFNLCVSNVPGPNIPVYMCGARLIAHYPASVITDGQGLNITVLGYLGQLHFGLLSCRELVPDLDELAGYLVDELELLVKAAGERPARLTQRIRQPGPDRAATWPGHRERAALIAHWACVAGGASAAASPVGPDRADRRPAQARRRPHLSRRQDPVSPHLSSR